MSLDLDFLAKDKARQLRARVIAQLGLAAPLAFGLACAGTPAEGQDEGGVTTDPSGGEGPTDAGDSSTAMSDESGAMDDEGESDDGGIKLDIGQLPDTPTVACEVRWLDETELATEYPDCDIGNLDPNFPYEITEVCVELPPGVDSCAEICVDGPECEGMGQCYDIWWEFIYVSCGFYEVPGGCCSVFVGELPPPVGRPFIVDGEARLARAEDLERLAEELAPEQFDLDDRLAAHWLDTARGEHASIAAFAQFIADLQRFAAPPRLLSAALAAASDEVEHTRLALALASRFAGRELELGPLEIRGALAGSKGDLRAAVRAAVIEGCVGETLAAHEASCLAALAEDPQVAAALIQIADDEARHAALAWGFVGWALRRDPGLRSLVAGALSSALAEPPATPASGSVSRSGPNYGPDLALGCPPPALRVRWRELGLLELVKPCARHLLETTGVGYQSGT